MQSACPLQRLRLADKAVLLFLFDIIEEEGTIFKNRDVFDLEYIPDDFEFRDSQLNTMILNSKKIKYCKAPNNMLLKGPNSTGKTSTVKKY